MTWYDLQNEPDENTELQHPLNKDGNLTHSELQCSGAVVAFLADFKPACSRKVRVVSNLLSVIHEFFPRCI